MTNLRKIIMMLVVALGVSSTILYFISGGPWGQYNSLYRRPHVILGISPLPLVFDSRNFFGKVFLIFTDIKMNRVEIELTSNKKFNHFISDHYILHYYRFFLFSSEMMLFSDKYKFLLCDQSGALVEHPFSSQLAQVTIIHKYGIINYDLNNKATTESRTTINCASD